MGPYLEPQLYGGLSAVATPLDEGDARRVSTFAGFRIAAGGELKVLSKRYSVNVGDKDAAKWTIVTYLPFLWRPEDHMFLKPEVTRDFAERVGHRFAQDYATGLEMPVYESLLDLALTTENEVVDLAPRDRVDVQSFIWIVGKYEDAA